MLLDMQKFHRRKLSFRPGAGGFLKGTLSQDYEIPIYLIQQYFNSTISSDKYTVTEGEGKALEASHSLLRGEDFLLLHLPRHVVAEVVHDLWREHDLLLPEQTEQVLLLLVLLDPSGPLFRPI